MNVQLRLYGFALAVVLLAALVGWAGHSAWQQLRQLRKNFGSLRSQSFHLAEHVEASVRSLSDTVVRFGLSKDPVDRARFHTHSQELKRWMAAQKSSTLTPVESVHLHQLEVACEAYLAATAQLLEEHAAQGGSVPAPEEVLEHMKNKGQILDLCAHLRAAERATLDRFVENANEALGGTQRLFMTLVAMVLFLGFTASSLIYRLKIAPLRAQLVESRAIIERQEKLAALGTLAAGVAHEIRNPLTAINVRLHSLKRTLVPASSEHEDAIVIDQEIQRLDRIVREVLQFARPSEPRLTDITAEELFNHVHGLLGSQLEQASIRLNVVSSPTLWIRVDPQQIEQVLINLIQNAAESIGQGGTITLRARSASLPLTSLPRLSRRAKAGHPAPAVILEVVDTGKGIPRKVQERLFDPFFTTKEAGTGLGLPIAARIVEKHGGTLQYQTEIDRGTTFAIVLPRAKKNDDEAQT